MSGHAGSYPSLGLHLDTETLLLPPFTDGEAGTYFGTALSISQLEEIYKVTKGKPANLAAVRRLVDGGTPPDAVIASLPNTLQSLFDVEWDQVDMSNERVLSLLGYLAHAHHELTLNELGMLLPGPTSDVRELLDPLSFVLLPESDDRIALFVSDTFKKYASSRLVERKEAVEERLIDFLLASPNSRAAVSSLPDYLNIMGKHDRLIRYLSPDHFVTVMNEAQSVTHVKQRVQIGIEAAATLNDNPELLRFAMQRSLLVDLDRVVASKCEVEARISVGDFDSALVLAQSALLKEDRLQLLALIATKTRQRGQSPDAELVEQIERLFEEVDFPSIGDKALSLASDLMGVRPDLAIRAVELSSNAKSALSADVAFARLSIRGALDRKAPEEADTSERIRSSIQNPSLRKMSTLVALLVGSYDQDELIKEVERVSNPLDRLYLLRQWLGRTHDGSKVTPILEYALKLAIQTTEYTPTATHLREFAKPLPLVSSPKDITYLVGVFDEQKTITEPLGPAQDYLCLQMTLAEALMRADPSQAFGRFEEALRAVSQLGDLQSRVSCYGTFMGSVLRLCERPGFGRLQSLEKECGDKLRDAVEEILRTTAEQTYALRDVLEELAALDGHYCLDLCQQLNTVERRDEAYELLLQSLEVDINLLNVGVACCALDSMSDLEARAGAYTRLLGWINRAIGRAASKEQLLERLKPLFGICDSLERMEERALCCGLAAATLAKGNQTNVKSLQQHLLASGYAAWQNIDSDENRVQIGFELAGILSKHHRERARAYLSEAAAVRVAGGQSILRNARIGCMRLGIRAFGALVLHNVDDETDTDVIQAQIRRFSSKYIRVAAWSELALSYFRAGREGQGKNIVNREIYPLLESLKIQGRLLWEKGVCVAAPSLVATNINAGLELISSLSYTWKDDALSAVLRFMFRKLPPADPIDYAGEEKFRITYGEARDICRVLRMFDSDSHVYLNIERLLASVRWKENGRNISEQQKVQICTDVESIIVAMLPCPRFIVHDGFAIIATAQLLKTRRAKDPEWNALIARARAVPNLADRIFVLATIARLYSGKDPGLQMRLFEEATALTDSLPCLVDRIDRYHAIAEEAETVNVEYAKGCLKAAIKQPVRDIDGDDAWRAQRRIVDTAHRISRDLAAALASEIDDDEARTAFKASLRNRVKTLDHKRELSKAGASDRASLKRPELAPDAARMALASLNSDRSEPVQLSELRQYLYKSSESSIHESYYMYSFAIENSARTFRRAPAAVSRLKAVFHATMRACDLAEQLTGHRSARLQKSAELVLNQPSASMLVRAGEREKGLQVIQRWIEDSAADHLFIHDPYMGPEEVGTVMKMVLRARVPIRLNIMTSVHHQRGEKITEPYQQAYSSYWARISDQEAPETLVLIVGLRSSKKSPVHPRWWLTRGSGLRVDTSLRSLGTANDSEIFTLTPTEVTERTEELSQYFELRKRKHNGERLEITTVTLP